MRVRAVATWHDISSVHIPNSRPRRARRRIMDRAPSILMTTVAFVLGALVLLTGVAWADPSGAANVPQILNVLTFQGTPVATTQQRTFLTTDPITAVATYYDPNGACAGIAPAVLELLFFNLEGQVIKALDRDVTGGVASTQLAQGSKYQVLSATLAPGALGAGAYNLLFLVRDCPPAGVNIFVSGFYSIRVIP
jgi:hypothetical protein